MSEYVELLARATPYMHLRALDEEQTGAMVALVPVADDVTRLAVVGGEAPDQLHVTLAYLGLAADITPQARGAVVEAIRAVAGAPVAADGFALSLFNPTNADRETCIVLGLSGAELDDVHDAVMGALAGVESLALPPQHEPWVAHMTLIYTDDADMLPNLVNRTGPVMFDRLRIAFGGTVTDIPLGPAAGEQTRAAAGQAVLNPFAVVRAAAAPFLQGLPDLPDHDGGNGS